VLLKIIALVSMLIDHAGILLFDDLYIMRLIGRLAFPLFAWFIVLGMKRGKNKIKYMRNLLILAIVSQPIYILSGIDQTAPLNIVFQLLAGVITILGIIADSKAYDLDLYTSKIEFSRIAIFISMPLAYFSEYGLSGYALILSLYFLNEHRESKFYLLIVILALLVNLQVVFWPVIYIFLYVIYSDIDNKIRYRKSFKYYFYAFYPVHMAILHVITVYNFQ